MKRSPLNRKTPLRAKRPTPRRNDGRVQHERMKRKAVSKTAAEARHLERVAKLPCCVSGKRPVAVHHLMKAPDKRCRRDHRWVVPLTPELHNMGDASVHALATEAAFEKHHGLAPGFLTAEAQRLWEESCRE